MVRRLLSLGDVKEHGLLLANFLYGALDVVVPGLLLVHGLGDDGDLFQGGAHGEGRVFFGVPAAAGGDAGG